VILRRLIILIIFTSRILPGLAAQIEIPNKAKSSYDLSSHRNSWSDEKIDSTIKISNALHWPYAYPEYLKIGFATGLRSIQLPKDNSCISPSFGGSLEFIWNQIIFLGPSYSFSFIPKNNFFKAATIHRIQLSSGILVQLDDLEKHHLILQFLPGWSILNSQAGSKAKFGLGLGIGYEYAINSTFQLSPEIIYYRYPNLDNYPYGLSGFSIGLRLNYGY
jgi:hypothetical protein